MTYPTLLRRVDAILSVAPDHMEDHYRELRLMRWDDAANDSIQVETLFQPHDEPVPWEIKVGHTFYRQGQTTGPRNLLVWFDHLGI